MENCTNLTEECAEISVNTEVEPRGTFAEIEQKEMTSFETLVHTVLALEEDPRDEHSYAYSDKKSSKDGMDKDHCYYSGSRLDSHRKIQSLSDENLFAPPTKNSFDDDKYFLLPHYRSNDSALDVTGFDNISEKCLSMDNLNVKTVEVFTENCILPGVSDPDLSMMTIQGHTSFSLPNSPPSSEIFVKDHSYSNIMTEEQSKAYIEQKREGLLKDHTYIDYSHWKRRESLPSNVGIKRGRSNDDLSLLGSNNFKRKDFTKSPFLDHSYQSTELRNENASNKRQFASKDNFEVLKTNKNMRKIKAVNDSELENKDGSYRKTYFVKQALLPNRLLMDHTYEEISDSTVDMPTGLVSKVHTVVENELAQMFKIIIDKSDHSYVIRKGEPSDKEFDNNLSADELSDSGTESLNGDDDDDTFQDSVNKHINPLADKEHKEHAYFKRTIKHL